jgi:hypothetical protein
MGRLETLRKIMAYNSLNRGPIPGVNIARNTASGGYRRGEAGLFAQVDRTLDITPNTLP